MVRSKGSYIMVRGEKIRNCGFETNY